MDSVSVPPAFSGGSYLQTLSRGMRILELLGDLDEAPTASTISSLSGLPKPVAYRILTTLKAHNFVRVDEAGRHYLGYALVSLARKVDVDFRNTARDLCARIAQKLNATTFIWVEDGDELVCTVSLEPSQPGTHVRWREGMRHSISTGASSAAILATRPRMADESQTVTAARERGYAISMNEIEPGIRATAVPIMGRDDCTMCIAVLTPASTPALTDAEVTLLKEGAARLSRVLVLSIGRAWPLEDVQP